MPELAINRKARFDYEILEAYEAGIELLGQEVKSVKAGRINLQGSFVVFRAGEAWLLNAHIPPYQPANAPPQYDPDRLRKLLLNRRELNALAGRLNQKGLTLVPLKVYTKKGLVKIEVGLARHRRKIDKRELLKKREAVREMRRGSP